MASTPQEGEWDRLVALAAELEPLIAAAFLETVDRLRASYTLAVIEDAIASGKLSMLIDNVAANPQAFAPLTVAVGVSVGRAAAHVLDNLPRGVRMRVLQPAPVAGESVKRPAASMQVMFDGTNPRAQAYVREQGAKLVVSVSDRMRESIQDVVTCGIDSGKGVGAMATEIRDFIGLTPTQTRAVQNFRRMLETQDSQALEMALRDKRFDRTLIASLRPGAPRLSASKIDEMVEARRQKALTMRAETIARTEAITALNTAQKAAWAQVVAEGGVLHADVRRYWHVARDERTCPVCMPIPRMNPEGVGLDETFKTPDGPVDGPTMHPKCRCTVFVKPFFRD